MLLVGLLAAGLNVANAGADAQKSPPPGRVPARIVALAPSLAELAADVAGEKMSRIVGVSEFSDFPPALKTVTSVGPYNRVNLETVVALKPDLVLATTDGNAKDQILRLRGLGIPVLVIDTGSFLQVAQSMKTVARAMGNEREGEEMAKRFEEGLRCFRERARKRQPRKVLLQLGGEPLIVAGKESFLHDALRVIGAVNAYGDTAVKYPRPSTEDAVKRDPDVVIVLALGHERTVFRRIAEQWYRFPTMRAVKNRMIRVIPGDAIVRPTLRLLEGLTALERATYED